MSKDVEKVSVRPHGIRGGWFDWSREMSSEKKRGAMVQGIASPYGFYPV